MMTDDNYYVGGYVDSGRLLRDRLFLENLSKLNLSPSDAPETIEMLIRYEGIKNHLLALENDGFSKELHSLSKCVRKTDEHLSRTIGRRAGELEQQVNDHKRLDKRSFVSVMDSLDALSKYSNYLSFPTESLDHHLDSVREQAHRKLDRRQVSYRKSSVDDKTINVYTLKDSVFPKLDFRLEARQFTSRPAIAAYMITGAAALLFFVATTRQPADPEEPSKTETTLPVTQPSHPAGISYHLALSGYDPKPGSKPFGKDYSANSRERSDTNSSHQRATVPTSSGQDLPEYTSRAKDHLDRFFGDSNVSLSRIVDSIEANDGLVTTAYARGANR